MDSLAFLKLLAHDLRWQMLCSLTSSDYRVNELVTLVGQPANVVSYHLKQMRAAGVVETRRSDADGRDVYYSLDLDRLKSAFYAAGAALHPALGVIPQPQPAGPSLMNIGSLRVLFVCTHNSARSQMAEGLLRYIGGDAVQAYSAGSHPTTIHPEAVRTMDSMGVDIREQMVHHMSTFLDDRFDYVITVCDNAREVCPTFKSEGVKLHWGLPDPAAIADAIERRDAFAWTARRLQARINYFLTHHQESS